MITKQKKTEIVAELVERFQKVDGFYLVDFAGMTVEDAVRFRAELKEQEMEMKVAKNTLIKIALKETDFLEMPDDIYAGQSALIFGYDDPVAPAKVIKKEFEKNQTPRFKGAQLDGQIFGGDDLKKLAALPTKQDVMASIVGSIHAPISGIVGSVAAVMRDLASLVEEVAKKQNEAA